MIFISVCTCINVCVHMHVHACIRLCVHACRVYEHLAACICVCMRAFMRVRTICNNPPPLQSWLRWHCPPPLNIENLPTPIFFFKTNTPTVPPAKSDSDVMFCLQSYQGLKIDRSLVYKSYPQDRINTQVNFRFA